MKTIVLASAALKPLFEENPNSVTELGIDKAVLDQIMGYLARTYIGAGEIDLAAKAARVSGNLDDERFVFDAIRAVRRPHHGSDSYAEDYMFLLLEVGTEEELREHLRHAKAKEAISILSRLNDGEGLLAYGRQLEELYYTSRAQKKEGERKYFDNEMDYALWHAITAYKHARPLLDSDDVRRELMRFADRLQEHDGIRAEHYHGHSSYNDRSPPHPLAQAYEATLAPEGFKKAANVYLELSKMAKYEEQQNDYLVRAARNFSQWEVSENYRTMDIAAQLAARQDIASAVKVARIAVRKVDFELLAQFASSAIQESVGVVRKAVLAHLQKFDRMMPFSDTYTFWSDSMGNDSWRNYVGTVNHLAGRFDESTIRVREGRARGESIAKYLYASDKAELIGKIHNVLERHLFVGWMLSGITYELKHGSHETHRKYEHPWYAAWRTFDEVGRGIREAKLGLPSDAVVKELHAKFATFKEKWDGLKVQREDGNLRCCGHASEELLTNELPAMQRDAKRVYDAIAQEIKGLVAQL